MRAPRPAITVIGAGSIPSTVRKHVLGAPFDCSVQRGARHPDKEGGQTSNKPRSVSDAVLERKDLWWNRQVFISSQAGLFFNFKLKTELC